MKTIKDAVIELGGKLPEPYIYGVIGNYATIGDLVAFKVNNYQYTTFCTVEEFEAESKRLGYINGYLWGVEYPTNGERPDLEDGTLVEARYPSGDWHEDGEDDVFDFLWKAFSHFRITDQRHKPADTSYLNGVSEMPESKHDAESVSEILHCKQKQPDISDIIIALSDASNLAVDLGLLDRAKEIMSVCNNIKAKSEREKVMEAAFECLKKDGFDYDATNADYFDALYNAGMLVLPPKKSDTKD